MGFANKTDFSVDIDYRAGKQSPLTRFRTWILERIRRNPILCPTLLVALVVLALLAYTEDIGFRQSTQTVVCMTYELDLFFWWPYHLTGNWWVGCVLDWDNFQEGLISHPLQYVSSVAWWFVLSFVVAKLISFAWNKWKPKRWSKGHKNLVDELTQERGDLDR